jgi:hypothetical protein
MTNHAIVSDRWVKLRGTMMVLESIYDQIFLQVLDTCHLLVPGVEYSVMDCFGRESWNELTEVKRYFAKKCLDDLVELRWVPLVRTSDPFQHSATYRLIAPLS